jgi:hypothetical protein
MYADAGELYYQNGQKVDGYVPVADDDIQAMSERIWEYDPEEMEDVNIE